MHHARRTVVDNRHPGAVASSTRLQIAASEENLWEHAQAQQDLGQRFWGLLPTKTMCSPWPNDCSVSSLAAYIPLTVVHISPPACHPVPKCWLWPYAVGLATEHPVPLSCQMHVEAHENARWELNAATKETPSGWSQCYVRIRSGLDVWISELWYHRVCVSQITRAYICVSSEGSDGWLPRQTHKRRSRILVWDLTSSMLCCTVGTSTNLKLPGAVANSNLLLNSLAEDCCILAWLTIR